MAKARRKKKNLSHFGARRGRGARNARRRHHFRRNPLLPSANIASLNDFVIVGLAAGGGGILSSWLPSRFLPSLDTGITGYGLNLLTGFGAAAIIAKASPKAAVGVAIGTLVMVLGRIWDAYTGQSVIEFNVPSSGASAFYAPGTFPLPAPTQGPYALPPAPAAKAGVHGMGFNPRFSSRFA